MATVTSQLQWAERRRVTFPFFTIGEWELSEVDTVEFVLWVDYVPLTVPVKPSGGAHASCRDAACLILQKALAKLQFDGIRVALVKDIIQACDPAAVVADIFEFWS